MTEFEPGIHGDVGLWMEDVTRHDWRGLPGLFLDRDGVILEELPYLGSPEKVRLIEGAAEAIRICNDFSVPVVIVTNQSGVGRGYYTWQDFADVQDELYRQLSTKGAHVDFVAACAYHEAAKPPYAVASHLWRKPNPGMILGVARKAGLNLHDSVMIGDRWTDIEAAANAGVARGIWVADGLGGAETQLPSNLEEKNIRVDVSASLQAAVALLMEERWPQWIQEASRLR